MYLVSILRRDGTARCRRDRLTTYLIDTNVFIQTKNLHYGFDFFPAFWQWLVERNEAGRVAGMGKSVTKPTRTTKR